MIKLIASDMDGTLLSSHLSVSAYNQQVVKEVQAQGIEFMVATGRDYSEAKPPLDEAGINCAMITGNGAQAYDAEGNVLFTIALEKETVKRTMALLRSEGLYFELMTSEGVYSDNQPQRVENFATMLAEHIPHITYKMAIAMASTHLNMLKVNYVQAYEELLENDDLHILKVITFSDRGQEQLKPIAEKVEGFGPVHVTSSFPNNIEINHRDAQKGKAVVRIAKERGIDLADVMAIGDNYNDVSMLELAGVSFAMGNAEPGVKTIAKYEAETNINDGVGKAIQRAIAENL